MQPWHPVEEDAPTERPAPRRLVAFALYGLSVLLFFVALGQPIGRNVHYLYDGTELYFQLPAVAIAGILAFAVLSFAQRTSGDAIPRDAPLIGSASLAFAFFWWSYGLVAALADSGAREPVREEFAYRGMKETSPCEGNRKRFYVYARRQTDGPDVTLVQCSGPGFQLPETVCRTGYLQGISGPECATYLEMDSSPKVCTEGRTSRFGTVVDTIKAGPCP